MLVMVAIENPANSVGKFICPRTPSGSTTLRLACTHLGSIALSQGLCFGSRQLMILTPSPLSLTRRLCFPSHLLTSLERCQEALSQMRTRTFFPAAWSSSVHHERNRVVMEETGLPSTNLSHVGHLGQIEPVAGDSLRLGVVLGDRPLDEAKGLAIGAPGVQGGQSHPAPPAFVLESHFPLGVGGGDSHQPLTPPFLLS